MKYDLILASASPRRKELLGHLGVKFEVISADIIESSEEKSPSEIVMDLAFQKALSVKNKIERENTFIIAADTIVVDGQRILGKPKSKQEAKETLLSLENKTHSVYTGVCYLVENEVVKFYEQSRVHFERIHPQVLDHYLKSGESMDKAGAYGIQGAALSFISHIEGSYSNIVGFPLAKFSQLASSWLWPET